MHSALTTTAKYAIRTAASFSAGVITTISLSVSTASASAVGEIVLVAGQCPGGFIPLDGRELKGDQYPELAAVLNTDSIALPPLAPRFSTKVETNQEPVKTRDPIRRPIVKDPKSDIGILPGIGEVNEPIKSDATKRDAKLGSLEPKYCIATGGDTAPIVEVGLEFVPAQQGGYGGKLVFKRVNASGFVNLPDEFLRGNIDLRQLALANPGITRPNVTFRMVNENICRAYEDFEYFVDPNKPVSQPVFTRELVYPSELRLSGVQIAVTQGAYPSAGDWGNDFDKQRENLLNGDDVERASFAYINKRDENGRPGFVAADIVDERTLILENRNTVAETFNYRVQAQCGDGDNAYNVYYDPQIEHDGRGGAGGYPY